MIYLYRIPEYNEQTVIGADPAEGNDYSAFVLLSKRTAEVLMIGQSKSDSAQLGYALEHVGRWVRKYTNCYPSIAPERNTGAATIFVLKQLNYPNIYRGVQSFTSTDSSLPDADQFGWHTNQASRPKMLDDLALAVRQKIIKLPSKVLIDELFLFIRNERTGKPEAEKGSNDDLVMSLAIAWQLYQLVPSEQQFYNFPKNDISKKNWRLK